MRTRFPFWTLIFTLIFFSVSASAATSENCGANTHISIMDKLISLPGVVDVQELESTRFAEKYLVVFEHDVNYNDASFGKFTQRVFVSHVHVDSATVVVTEGYNANYAARPSYREEFSTLFNTNLVVVEHRYFDKSTPKNIQWEFMKGEFAARDLHEVVTSLKTIYQQKWVATGISKGGQNVAIYRAHYPEDVDISIPYVAPFCSGVEDGRHEPFIAEYCGTPQQREVIKNFQIELLKRRDALLPKLDSLAKADRLEFNIPLNEVYDYCVLEFSFALWQWGTPVSSIPSLEASDGEVFKYFVEIAGPSYFEKWGPTSPFFIQAAQELGYYGYDRKPFKKWLSVKDTKGYLQKIFLPQDQEFRFDDTLSKKLEEFIRTTDSKMLFIYGEFDPWSAVKVQNPNKENIKIFIEPKGSHRARINTFPDDMRGEIISILSNWLYN